MHVCCVCVSRERHRKLLNVAVIVIKIRACVELVMLSGTSWLCRWRLCGCCLLHTHCIVPAACSNARILPLTLNCRSECLFPCNISATVPQAFSDLFLLCSDFFFSPSVLPHWSTITLSHLQLLYDIFLPWIHPAVSLFVLLAPPPPLPQQFFPACL